MRYIRMLLALLSCLFVLAALASAQGRKPGLYETDSEMTWQQSPFPAGMQLPPQAAGAFGGGRHTSEVCVTQEQIDRYGDVPPQTQGDCHVTNISKSGNSMKGEMVCTGMMEGTGDMESSWSEGGRGSGSVHFVGTMRMEAEPMPVEWTMHYTTMYVGPDCGRVKPLRRQGR